MNREILFRCLYGGKMYGNEESMRLMYNNTCDAKLLHNDAVFMQFTGLQDKNGVDIYEGDLVRIRTPYRTTQTHEGDNIPNGSYTEPMEPGIRTHISEVVFLDGMFQIAGHLEAKDEPYPLTWILGSWDGMGIKEAISIRGMIWDDPEEGDLQYLLGLAGVETLEELIHYFGAEVAGNKFETPELSE